MKMLTIWSVVLAAVMLTKFTTASPVSPSNDINDSSSSASSSAAAVCGVPAIEPIPPGERIVGGIEAKPNSWPWMCLLEINFSGKWVAWCGCSVLNNVTLLTGAAGCIFGADAYAFRVRCGIHYRNSSNPHEQTIGVSNRTIHELFNKEPSFDYDIAILKLATPLTINDFVSPVCLPQNDVEPGIKVITTGWGSTTEESRDASNELRQVTVLTVSQKECINDYGAGKITDRMLCAGVPEGGKGVCWGDVGDPLITKRDNMWEVQGFVSWGQGCARKGLPAVFTRVTQFLDWIKQRL